MVTSEHRLRILSGDSPLLRLAQAGWLVLAALSIAILVASIPGYLFSPSLGVLDEQLVIIEDTAAYNLMLVTVAASFLSSAGSVCLAIFLFQRKRDDPMGQFLAYYLLGHGILFAGAIEMLHPIWGAAPWVNSFILLPLFSGPATMALIALFPDGRFVPRWTRWLIPISFFYAPAASLALEPFQAGNFGMPQALETILIVLMVVASIGLVIAAIYAQIYRYRKVSTAEQRQQTKWVLYGLGLWMVIGSVASIVWPLGLRLPSGTAMPYWLPLASLAWVTSSMIFPISLTISITRHRLFEIDLIINRTLVYGSLTLGVILVYVLVVGVLGILFQTQFNMVLAFIGTAIVAIIVQPLRMWLQGWINRLVFGVRDDPIEALSRLGSRLESTVNQDLLLPTLVETIAKNLKLPYVAITVINRADGNGSRPNSESIAAAIGSPRAKQIEFPLTFQGDDIGRLTVGSRGTGLPFSQMELRLLRNIAHQAGAAVNAVRLTADLQRSRQQIVTAREEERRRLRRDLHDGIGPAMAGQRLKLDATLDLLESYSKTNQAEDLGEATQLLLGMREQTLEAVKNIRQIVYDLRPPALDDLGLLPAIEAHISKQTGYEPTPKITLRATPESLPQLPAAIELALYRITLEGLTNVFQHAKAQHCWVSLALSPAPNREIQLEIIDDGRGLSARPEKGVGLSSMRERAEELGGRFQVTAHSPSGVIIRATIPLNGVAD